MAIDIDAVLLHRVFQPVVDHVADWASPYALARTALVVAAESQALALLLDAMADRSLGNLAVSASIAMLTGFGARQAWRLIARAEQQGRAAASGVRRFTSRRQRLGWLGIGGACVLFLLPQADIRAASASLGCMAWVALIYFVSCTPRPPAGRRSSRFVPSAS